MSSSFDWTNDKSRSLSELEASFTKLPEPEVEVEPDEDVDVGGKCKCTKQYYFEFNGKPAYFGDDHLGKNGLTKDDIMFVHGTNKVSTVQ